MSDKPFKMKGSPLQRNFGIGSPAKQPEYGTRNKKLPTYRESWDMNNKNVQSKHTNYENYEKAAIDYNRKHGVKTSSESYKIKDGTDK